MPGPGRPVLHHERGLRPRAAGVGAFGNQTATIVIDRQGVIRSIITTAAGKNDSNRPPPEQLLKIIDGFGKK